jgi:hypothetical protein
MEVILIFIALAIIGFVIYQSSPKIKFQKGEALFNSGKYKEAINIFDSIFDKHPNAPAKLAECKLKEGLNINSSSESDALKLFNEVIDFKKRLKANANKKLLEPVEAKAYFAIAGINYNNSIKVSNLENRVKQISGNLNFIENATKLGIESDFAKLQIRHFTDLAEINFTLGSQSEKSTKIDEAINRYSTAKNYAAKSSNLKIIHNSVTRTGICTLKKNQHNFFLDEIQDNISKAPLAYQHEFYYRYAIRLIKEENNTLADKIISSNLNFASPPVEKLQKVIKNRKLVNAQKKIDEINSDLDELYQKSFSVPEVKNLYDNLDKRIEEISSAIPSMNEKLCQLKPSLFNRLLIHYISEEQYSDAIILIQKFPFFWESPELLKNLGICCYGLTAQGNLTERNYRSIISCWLTSVFSDKVILKSLEDTVWDDEYTFTLIESIGSNYSQHTHLPDNVNYEDVCDTNISIGATQKELLTQYEVLLSSKVSDSSLAKNIADFYDEEKEAIEKIVSVIESDILFTTPCFAKTYNINESIVKELNDDFRQYTDERSLDAGLSYLNGNNTKGAVDSYASAKAIMKTLISSIYNEDLDEVKALTSSYNKSLVQKFNTIGDSVEDSIYNAFSAKIEEDDENEDLFDLMEDCINFSVRNEKLKYQYSNYLINYSVAKVNSDEIDNFKALTLMRKAYLYARDNERICKNFITLIRYNLLDIINDRTSKISQIYKLLDEVYSERSEMFNNFSYELVISRNEILNSLEEKGVNISSLINEDSSFIVQDYINHNLTTEGRKLKIALSYMKKIADKHRIN